MTKTNPKSRAPYFRAYRAAHPELKAKQLKYWTDWVAKNPERRREIALASYHRRARTSLAAPR